MSYDSLWSLCAGRVGVEWLNYQVRPATWQVFCFTHRHLSRAFWPPVLISHRLTRSLTSAGGFPRLITCNKMPALGGLEPPLPTFEG